ncbi:threonine aspartase [Verticillium dahliae VdLs.17]|uniref:Threonine aspartase n=1 Tax=Verticillium dahliae (strain VdLs.17 / ATCC MYA-4575 / FGSC 10137) TaxID=498257 RepID=G2XBH3_VERDV|nr:threonine aspartase [Verticillium dahliae VdLs.17]EGY16341.1 threonine aspartase [Verticillium dahliae VdLs.17]KAH6699370.1 threonine aspartase [Verticillium dahliae]
MTDDSSIRPRLADQSYRLDSFQEPCSIKSTATPEPSPAIDQQAILEDTAVQGRSSTREDLRQSFFGSILNSRHFRHAIHRDSTPTPSNNAAVPVERMQDELPQITGTRSEQPSSRVERPRKVRFTAANSLKSPPGGTDGTVDRVLRRGQRSKFTGAIFIHAGAGFHSHQNERVHLEACNDAATMGMKFLRSGASATEAVEAALRVLEDKEITNAGYGSNLSIEGTVECDATIVDYLGRSGACGAAPNVRNPICLAKLILDKSNQPLTLRRVPPNILVGAGAKGFASEHGMQTVPNDSLISKNARDRFLRWQDDLLRAEEKLKQDESCRAQGVSASVTDVAACLQYETGSNVASDQTRAGNSQQRDHANAILTGTWNEGQPDSPYRGSPALEKAHGQFSVPSVPGHGLSRVSPAPGERSPLSYVGAMQGASTSPKRHHPSASHGNPPVPSSHPALRGHGDGGRSPQPLVALVQMDVGQTATRHLNSPRGSKRPFPFPQDADDDSPPLDMITDTIGAIAIDDAGHIAAGSSSGGIGMKHCGRLGPAALVGIGTAVVPSDPSDPEGISVATVTSGTGEHMATTMASQRCAERIYSGTRRGVHGRDVQEDDEDLIMESFITNDFMGHPGVRNCNSVGAIGVMTVKKTRAGYYLYFAHNTDSFALASMGGADKEPQCVMSRLGNTEQVTRGARKISVGG